MHDPQVKHFPFLRQSHVQLLYVFKKSYYLQEGLSLTSLFTETTITFVVNATSEVANEAFELMKESIKDVMNTYKNQPVKYQLLIHGKDSFLEKINSDRTFNDVEVLNDPVDQPTRGTEAETQKNIPALHKDLKKVREAFERNSDRRHAEKVGDLLALYDYI